MDNKCPKCGSDDSDVMVNGDHIMECGSRVKWLLGGEVRVQQGALCGRICTEKRRADEAEAKLAEIKLLVGQAWEEDDEADSDYYALQILGRTLRKIDAVITRLDDGRKG